MKTIQFKNNTKKGIMYGTIKIKDDKTSISISNASIYSNAEKYRFKILANQIITADFIHPAVISIKEDSKNVLDLLKQYTEDLKIDYINKCKNWEEFNYNKRFIELNEIKNIPTDTKEWYDYFQLKYVEKKYQNDKIYYVPANTKEYHKTRSYIVKLISYINNGKENAILKAEKNALLHYLNSLDTLCQRIEQKQMNIDKMSIIKSGIDLNIELVLSDGVVTIKAWTIIASGEIQKPHYRYLVK
jgi:hypothetical protein